jgi:hypothetical protein
VWNVQWNDRTSSLRRFLIDTAKTAKVGSAPEEAAALRAALARY